MGRGGLDPDFEDFVRQRTPALLRTARLMAGDEQLGEDLLQQALWKVARRWRTARDNPVAYTRKTLANLSTDAHRRRRSRPPEAIFETSVHDRADPDRRTFDAALADRDALLSALRQLPARQRTIVVLRYYEDLNVEQAAEALGCSTGTVKSTTSRAIARLRELLDDKTPERHPC